MSKDTSKIRLAIGADHRGYPMKEFLKTHTAIDEKAITWIDVGAYSQERSDYPLFAQLVCKKTLAGEADGGVLLCGSGVGMSIAANRFNGIYAGLVWNDEIARLNKEDDNVNVIVFPSDFITNDQALQFVRIWLSTPFKNGRYQSRIAMIDSITQ